MTRVGLLLLLVFTVVAPVPGCSLFRSKSKDATAPSGPRRRTDASESPAAAATTPGTAAVTLAPAPAAAPAARPAGRPAPAPGAAPAPGNSGGLQQELAFLRDDPNRPLEPALGTPPSARPDLGPPAPVPAGTPPTTWVAPGPTATTAALARAPAGATLHVVRKGETLFGIARSYGASVPAIVEANHLRDGSRLDVGQKLVIPGVGEGMRSLRRGEPPSEIEPAAASEAGYLWPVQGQVLADHGTVGLEIGAPMGAEVRATKSGVVAFASERFQGFGRTIVLRHSDGAASFYAFCSQLLVREGEQVRQGQAIARVGDSGRADLPLLLFRVYRDGKPVAPLRLLP